jgi:hypothetical protein
LGVVLLAMSGTPARAREGFFLWLGSAQQTGSGDLDGFSFVGSFPDGATGHFTGALQPGDGYVVAAGYGVTRFVALEAFQVATQNRAVGHVVNEQTTATVETRFLGVRASLPLGMAIELFARIGESQHSVSYRNFTLISTQGGTGFFANVTGRGTATFTGSGLGYGVGAEYLPGNWGVSIAYTQFDAVFDQAHGGGDTADLDPLLHEALFVTTATVLYHF